MNCEPKSSRSLPAVDVGLQCNGGQAREKCLSGDDLFPVFPVSWMQLQNRNSMSGTRSRRK